MKIEVWNGEGKDILYLLQKQLQLTQISISLLNSLSPWGDTNDYIEFQSSYYTTYGFSPMVFSPHLVQHSHNCMEIKI